MAVPVRLGPLQRSAPFGTPLIRNKDRAGLDSLLPERYHAWKSASSESLLEGSRAAKHEKIQSLYDHQHVVASREALQNKILRQSKGTSKEEPEPLQSDLIRDWRLAEKQRANINAERYWKSKFLHWQRNHLARINHDQHAEEMAALQNEIGKYDQDIETLSEMHLQLEEEIAPVLEDLQVEEGRCSSLEAEIQVALDERNTWMRKAYSHKEKRHRLEEEQLEILSQIKECYRHAESMGITIPVAEAKGEAGFYEERRRELAAIKIQALHRGRLARKRVAALRVESTAEAEYEASFDEEARGETEYEGTFDEEAQGEEEYEATFDEEEEQGEAEYEATFDEDEEEYDDED